MTHRLLLIFFCTLLPATTAADEFEYLQGLQQTEYLRVDAEKIGRPYHIYVMLPDSYQDEPSRAYPTIYLLDAGNLLPMLGVYYRYLGLADETPDAIIVGISYGSNRFEDGNFRSTDLTAPAADASHWGGAEAFRDFLARELIPAVEDRFRSDRDRRILFGHSLGGQFVLFAAQTRPDLFWGYIASNPALHRNLDFFLKERPVESTASRLFVASSTLDVERFRTPALAWIRHWTSVGERSWELQTTDLEGHTHLSALPASFRQGLAWLYPVDSPD